MTSVSVTAAELQRDFAHYHDTATKEIVVITEDGEDSLVLLSAAEYRRLKRYDREALYLTELTEEELEAILTAEIPPEAAEFDHELEG